MFYEDTGWTEYKTSDMDLLLRAFDEHGINADVK